MGAVDEPDDLSAPPLPGSHLPRAAPTAPPETALPVPLEPGRKLGERYVIVRPLGSGGMGEVYLARDVTLEREVAIKRHRQGREVDRLRREAIAMARLAHPNVVTVFEVGEIEGGVYVAMEYVPGTTLRGYLAERRRSPRELLGMLRAIGEGLAAAHEAGIVHRDFKPENVLIGKDGRPRISDFGLARDARSSSAPRLGDRRSLAERAVADDGATDESAGQLGAGSRSGGAPPDDGAPPRATGRALALASTIDGGPVAASGSGSDGAMDRELTLAGTVVGTPAYMAPEQASGGVVDVRADQFAFCVVAWEALFGVRPRDQPAGASSKRLVTPAAERGERAGREPIGRGRASRRIRAALLRGLAEDPTHRHPSLRALLDELAERRRWRAFTIAAIALAAGLAAWQLTREAPLRCDDAGEEIAELRAPLLQQVARAGGAASVHLTSAFEEFRRGYRATAGATCRAHRDRGWSSEQYLRARGCLTTQRQLAATQLAAVDSDGRGAPGVSALRGSPEERATAAALAAAARALPLPTPARCEDSLQLTGTPPPPRDQLEQVAAARATLVLAERSLDEHDLERAAAWLDEVAAEAVARQPYVAARRLLLRARQTLANGAIAQGEAQLTEARAAAISAGDAETQLLCAAAAITIGATHLDRTAVERSLTTALAEAEAMGTMAPEAAARVYLAAAQVSSDEQIDDAALEDAGNPSGDAAAATESAVGDGSHGNGSGSDDDDDDGVFLSVGNLHSVASTRGAQRTLELLAKAKHLLGEERGGLLLLDVLQRRAEAHMAAGRFGDALADQLDVLQRARALLGRDHPRVARLAAECALELGQMPATAKDAERCAAEAERLLASPVAALSLDLARARRALGRYRLDLQRPQEGRALLEQARAQLTALAAPGVERADLGVTLALAINDAGMHREALPLLEESLALQERTLPSGHFALANTLYNLAVVERDLGRLPAARQHARRASDIFGAHRAIDRYRLALALTAALANHAGDPDAALAATAEALRWSRGSDPLSLAWPRLERARALLTKGGAARQAHFLLSSARALYEMLGLHDRVAEIDRLLVQASKQAVRSAR